MGVNQFTTASGGVLLEGILINNGTLDLNGTANSLILDADGDTHISSPSDDQIDVCLNGSDDFTFTSNSFNVLTGSAIAGPSSTFVPLIPIDVMQSLSGAGAINVTSYYTAWTTTAANAGTLANGVVKGQLKKIEMVVDGGDGTLTPTSLSGGTNIVFDAVGDMVLLVWNGTAWVVIESSGTVAS